MVVPSFPNLNLYQTVMMLGAFVMIVAVFQFGNVTSDHGKFIQANVDRLFDGDKTKDDARKFWYDYMKMMKKDTEFSQHFLIGTSVVGFVIMCIGAGFWYTRVQKLDDLKRAIEKDELQHTLDEKRGKKKLVV